MDSTIADTTITTSPVPRRPRPITQLERAERNLANDLAAANGRRRQRVLGLADVTQAVREALRHGWGSRAGETVPNSYGYPSRRTLIYAACDSRGHVRVWVSTGSASCGSGRYPILACHAERRGHAEQWAETATEGLLLSRRVALTLVRQAEVAARATHADAFVNMPEVDVTLLDSTAAGNCDHESRRVAAWFSGSESVPARVLLSTILEREPHLLTYARRAVDAAAKRVAQLVAQSA